MADLVEVIDNKLRLNLHPGQTRAWESTARFVFIVAGTQSGKALAADTLLPTPQGHTQLADIQTGMMVFGPDGQPCQVTYVTPLMYDHPVYRIDFDDGVSLFADADHRWRVQTIKQRKNAARRVGGGDPRRPQCLPQGTDYSVCTTAELTRETLILNGHKWRCNYSVDLTEAVAYPTADLPLPPYVLGAWLGDGTATGSGFTCADAEIIEQIRSEGVPVGEGHVHVNQGQALTYYLGNGQRGGNHSGYQFVPRLRKLGVFDNKHIPACYKFADHAQRLALLQGLLDTDGYVQARGDCEFSTISPRLALDILELLRSLGIKARHKISDATLYGRVVGERHRITFTTAKPVFRLSRKLSRLPKITRPDVQRRFITAITPVASVPVKCIAVDHPTHEFLVSTAYVPTHNTSFTPHLFYRWVQETGAGDYLAATATYDLFDQKFLPEMQKVFCQWTNWGHYIPSKRTILSHDGESRIILRSASSPGGLESSTIRGALLDEAGHPNFQLGAWEAIQRRLSLEQGRVLAGTTPYDYG